MMMDSVKRKKPKSRLAQQVEAVLRADFNVHLVILFQVDAQTQYNNGSTSTRPVIKHNHSRPHAVRVRDISRLDGRAKAREYSTTIMKRGSNLNITATNRAQGSAQRKERRREPPS
jgi:hypothetical protein